jgi:AraC family transcriptional regulator, regulatory protein of adaptative response / methylated-DNA-[protein]-cysteine methyltransferase
MPRAIANSSSIPTRSPLEAQDEARWAAVVLRDKAFDGHFVIAVETTGIYCRPSCPSRRPNRANVRFFDTAEAAERAGFRPCKRCKPTEPSLAENHAEKVREACRLIEAAEDEPKLDDLAASVGLSPYHFHRIFKSVLGVTPKAYATAHRNKRVRDGLGRRATVTEAIYEAGFNSNGRFYATAAETLGMTPSEFRSGGKNAEIKFAVGECSLGSILVAASEKGVCAILFGDDPERLRRELDRQFPVGSTASYAEIAEAIGAPSSARAVAQACAQNRIAVAIPCHRVVRSDGSLSGYRGGVHRKRALLAKEAKS